MNKKDISRRNFLDLLGKGIITGIGTSFLIPSLGYSSNNKSSVHFSNREIDGTANPITAAEIIDRIKKNVGVTWREPTVDVIKGGGNPNVVVTGIVTTFMATMEILEEAAKSGKNFIISHEPIFWSNLDSNEGLTDDPMYLHKLDYMKKNNLIVWRFHDHWHSRKPDGISEGFYKELGWDKYQMDEARRAFVLPETISLEDFAKQVKTRLKSDTVRVVGNPQMKVKKVNTGSNHLAGSPNQLQFADAFIVKEADRENDLVEWCRDCVAAGQEKGFIFISHNRGEESGMENCAKWVRSFISEVPVEFIPSGEPFWRTLW